MNQHLSAEQISAWLIDQQGAVEQQHLDRCAPCRQKVERLEAALSHFRASLHHASVSVQIVGQALPPANRARHPVRWALAAAALLILVSVPLYQAARHRSDVRQAEQDAILLDQVDRAVSRSVPRPLEPLIQLVEWGPVPAKGNSNP